MKSTSKGKLAKSSLGSLLQFSASQLYIEIYRDVQLPVDVDSPIMNTAVRRNASVMTRNFCVSRLGEPVLDQESSWNFNQVTNQTEVGGIGQLNPRHCERNNAGQRSTTVILFLFTKYEKNYFT